MPYTPHSLLDAAKLTASAAGLDWAIAHRFYRDLQGGGRSEADTYWLPKSLGRNIWAAHPNFLACLLIGIGMSETPANACAAVTEVAKFTPGGRGAYMVELSEFHVRDELALLLGDPAKADAVERVEFDPVEMVVEIRYRDGTNKVFAAPGSADETLVNGVIYRRGVIPGAVFATLSRTINWRVDSPLTKVPDGTVDAEA